MERVIVLVDMDCFYVQVEQRLDPSLNGKPCAVLQYNAYRGGGIIAVSYEARAQGVSRRIRGAEAQKICPDIKFARVPEVRGKADLTRYREAGAEVIATLCKFSSCVERASIDEAYLDLTNEVKDRLASLSGDITSDLLPNTHVVGWDDVKISKDSDDAGQDITATIERRGVSDWLSQIQDDSFNVYDKQLAMGAVIAEEMRAAVYKDTGFRCSAGIGHNKMLAKIACGVNKPNKQTVLPHSSVPRFYATLPVNKLRNFGGKLGVELREQLGCETMSDVCKYSEQELVKYFGQKTGSWLYQVCLGFDSEAVSDRLLPKSIGCSKNFLGPQTLNTRNKVHHWMKQLSIELEERLVKDKCDNKRVAKSMSVGLHWFGANKTRCTATRTVAITCYDGKKLADDAFAALQQFNHAPPHQQDWTPGVINLSMSCGKFVDDVAAQHTGIDKFFTTKTNTSPTKVVDPFDQFVSQTQEVQNKTSKPKSYFTASKSDSSPLKVVDLFDQFETQQTQKPQTVTSKPRRSIETFFKTSAGSLDSNKTVTPIEITSENYLAGDDDQSLNNVLPKLETKSKSTASLGSKGGGFFANREKLASAGFVSRDEGRRSNTGNTPMLSETHEKKEDYPTAGPSRSIKIFAERETQFEESNMCDRPENISDADAIDSSDMTMCDKCHTLISAWDLPEHLDYHMAVELQGQMNSDNNLPASSSTGVQSVKRKLDEKPAKGRGKKSKVSEKSTSLDKFFKKS